MTAFSVRPQILPRFQPPPARWGAGFVCCYALISEAGVVVINLIEWQRVP